MNQLRIIFMGTPEFAVSSLEALVENKFHVIAVISAPDKPQGRGQKMTASPVKVCAIKYGIPVLQPTNLKSPEFLNELKTFNANLQIVVAFRMLPEVVWSLPSLGTFNLHASLLPQYRGAAPINWSIINGEKQTGTTTFFIQHEIDTGSIIYQQPEPILETDDAGSLYNRLKISGARLVVQTVEAIANGAYPSIPQAEIKDLKSAPKIFKETCAINWNQSTKNVVNFVRGLSPHPTAWTTIDGKVFKIFRVKPAGILPHDSGNLKGERWQTDNKSYLYFPSTDGWVSVEELQPEGKRRMAIGEFFRGNKLVVS